MANFSMFDDDEEYAQLFITQEPRQEEVSLEENVGFKSVLDPQYSDISDEETDQIGKRLR